MYQLMIKKGNKYEPIMIRDHKDFVIVDNRNLQNHLATLREIDLLTTQYSETEFRYSLVRGGLIGVKNFNNQISIRYLKDKSKNKFDTLTDSIIYKDGKSYLDKDTLECTLKILCGNSNFVRELIDKYMPKEEGRYNTRECINVDTLKMLEGLLNNNININGLRDYLIPYMNIFDDKNLLNNLYIDNRMNIIKNIIKIFLYNEIYERRKNVGEYDVSIKDYRYMYEYNKEKIRYKALHDLAKFVYDYDSKRRQEELEEHEFQEEFLEPGEISFEEEPVIIAPVKKRKRVRKPLEGQTSLFD